MNMFNERDRVVVVDTGATATVLAVAGRWGSVTVQVDEQYLSDPEDDGVMEFEAGDLRPVLVH